MTTRKVIQYWRRSLLDAELSAIELTSDNHLRLDPTTLRAGQLSPEQVARLINVGNYEDPEPMAVAPIVALRRFRRGRSQTVICPVWISASLDLDGNLIASTPSDPPWIPRELLEPTRSDLVLGSIDDYENYWTKNQSGLPEGDSVSAEDWQSLLDAASAMLHAVAGEDWPLRLNDADFVIEDEAAILPLEQIGGVSTNIVRVYDKLIATNTYPPLLDTYLQLQPPPAASLLAQADWCRPAQAHLGSFNNQFPLSPSQREALYHFLNLPTHTTLAISGPPGTGTLSDN